MAALTTQVLTGGVITSGSGAITTVAPTAGGDTGETGASSAGWVNSPTFLWVVVGATATTITINGTAYGPYTSNNVLLPIPPSSSAGARVNITYSQVVNVTGVAVLRLGPAFTGVTFGT